MTIRETTKIDVIGTRGDHVVLAISDDLDWSDPDLHEALLQDKLNAYLSFVESGQLAEVAPLAHDGSIEIRLVVLHRPTPRAESFLVRVRELVERAGYSFVVDVRVGEQAGRTSSS